MGIRARNKPGPLLQRPRHPAGIRFFPRPKNHGKYRLLHRPAHNLRTGAASGAVLLLVAAGLLAGSAPAAASQILGGIDMQRACNTQYYDAFHIRAVVLHEYDAYSWRCARDEDTTNGIDMDLACIIQYGGDARAGLTFWWNAYSWFCFR